MVWNTKGMKHLQHAAVAAALLLSPLFVFAEETDVAVTAEAGATTEVKSEKPLPNPPRMPAMKPAPLKMLKGAASSTKEAVTNRIEKIKETASSTREAGQMFLDKRKAEVQALMERKPKGEMSSTTAAKMEAKREEMRGKLEAKKEEVKNRIQAAREKAKEKFGEAVQRSVGNIADRLTKATEHLTSIATRIDARIKERETEGKDMSVSIGLLATARTDIAAAQDKVTTVGTVLTAALSATNPKEEMSKVREAVRAAEDSLKQAKESLHKTLESLRTEASAEATTSTTTN